MMKKIFLTLAITLSATSIFAQSEIDRPLVTVSGQAEVMVVPDKIVSRSKVENVNLDVNKTKAKTDDDVKKLLALARSYKIESQNVQTDFIRSSEHYTPATQNNIRKFDGYAVTQTKLPWVRFPSTPRRRQFRIEVGPNGIRSHVI